ncbi:FkbM family methyltransferase [Methylophaga sp.]|uniref:FkbM family methyltransferase n=1 Tax=Methylophaga sp. TaxID=2024840 RepID=UPI0025D2009A|nr:FkbM family methyltransferase [Methylophaga sp.]
MEWQSIKKNLKKINLLVKVVRVFRSFFIKLISLEYIYEFFKFLLKKVNFSNWGFIRRLSFEISNGFLVSDCEYESFIVSANDNAIGKRVFLKREPFEIEKLYTVMSLLKQGNDYRTFVDVGANIGVTCLPAIKRNFFKKAIAIEPDKLNYRLLKSNIALNNLEDFITSYNYALGDVEDTSVTLEMSNQNYGDHRVRKTLKHGSYQEELREIIEVPSTTLDSVLLKEDDFSPDSALIWIDTQGFEGHILAGASKALKSTIPLCVEFWPYGMSRADSYEPFINALENLSYTKIYDLKNPEIAIPFSRKSFDEIYYELGEFRNRYTDLLII